MVKYGSSHAQIGGILAPTNTPAPPLPFGVTCDEEKSLNQGEGQ